MKEPPQYEREALENMPVGELVEVIVRQQEWAQQIYEEIESLKAVNNRSSKDSSKPPSSDLLKRSEKKVEEIAEEEGKKKVGGQFGHKGKTRKGFNRVDRFETLSPEGCPNCGGQAWTEIGVSIRQTARLVEQPIEIVEYQQQECQCKHCGAVVWGELPKDVIGEQDLEASLQGMLVWLGNYGHMSYKKQQELLKEMGLVEIGLGTIAATNERVADSIEAKVEELADWIKDQPQVQVDETPWLVKGVKEWLWSFSGEGYALYRGADTRSRAELESMLGESYDGVLCSDDYSVYNGYAVERQQKCLAHLRRHFKALLKLTLKSQQEIGRIFIRLIDEAFEHHATWQKNRDTRPYFNWAIDFKKRVSQAISDWMPKVGYAAGNLLKSLKKKSAQWWYFLENPHVPPDNNRAERNLRLAVTKRKVCGGSRSMDGFRNTAALLTVIQTCKAQGKSVIDFFRQALIDPSSISLIPILT
ncbi:IS66 family transposase [Pseudanabaena minima]